MGNKANIKTAFSQESNKIQNGDQSNFNRLNMEQAIDQADAGKDVYAKILKITLTIKEQNSEISKYLEEMTETIPVEKNQKNLRKYHKLLNWLLKSTFWNAPKSLKYNGLIHPDYKNQL